MDIKLIIFIAVSAVTVGSACVVAFARNIVYCAFALLGVFAGVLGLYIMLSADFVAVVQLVVYIGGILILLIFAVLLTTRIGERRLTNRPISPFAAVPFTAALGWLMWRVIKDSSFPSADKESFLATTTTLIGDKLLQEYLLPFEIISLLLILVLVGAVVIARRETK